MLSVYLKFLTYCPHFMLSTFNIAAIVLMQCICTNLWNEVSKKPIYCIRPFNRGEITMIGRIRINFCWLFIRHPYEGKKVPLILNVIPKYLGCKTWISNSRQFKKHVGLICQLVGWFNRLMEAACLFRSFSSFVLLPFLCPILLSSRLKPFVLSIFSLVESAYHKL